MKRIISVPVALLIVTQFSCVKKRMCSCVSPGMPQLEIIPQEYKATKASAQKNCDEYRDQVRVHHPDAVCELK